MEYLGTKKTVNNVVPVVSVCVTTYNHAAYISECLDNILNQQTDFPFEIIVGEDDSSDGTREICKQYADKYSDKIRLFLRDDKDKIYIGGRKTGRFNFTQNILVARGKYIALCEGDDYWTDPLKLQKQFDFLEENPEYVLIGGKVELIFERDGFQSSGEFYGGDEDFDFDLPFLFHKNPIATLTAFFRNGLVTKFPKLYMQHGAGDRRLYMQLLKQGKGRYIAQNYGHYRKHSLGATHFTSGNKSRVFRIYLKTIFSAHNWNKQLGNTYGDEVVKVLNRNWKKAFKYAYHNKVNIFSPSTITLILRVVLLRFKYLLLK